MPNAIDILKALSIPPQEEEFSAWLEQKDAITFLKANLHQDDFIIYASFSFTFMHAVFIPADLIISPDINDLMAWSCDAASSWGICQSFKKPEELQFSIEPPLNSTGSKTLDKGEQIVFARFFEGRVGKKNYFEILQKFTHPFGLHFIQERNAYCRIDKHGDLEDVISIITIPNSSTTPEGAIISCKRELLDEYMVITKSVIIRTFDFTRYRLNHFGGWPTQAEKHTTDGDLFYRTIFDQDNASCIRGCQIVHPSKSDSEILKRHDFSYTEETEYTTFIANDWKYGLIHEVSCDPKKLGNYFVKSDLPLETSPVFFRPEVLLKYKADSEKYTLKDRSITCRGAWHLQTYDINEAGQVHTYLVYLGNLPYEEQLYWRSFNEKPRASISKRAYKSDFEASWGFEYDPLNNLRKAISELNKNNLPWWRLRSEELMNQVHYPVTTSTDEWANELLQLDKFLVEGFVQGCLKDKAILLGRTPDVKFASLKLLEECLIGLGFEEDGAKDIVAPFFQLHDLRTKLKGHTSGTEAQEIKKGILAIHGSYKRHFRDLVEKCDKSLRIITEAFEKLP